MEEDMNSSEEGPKDSIESDGPEDINKALGSADYIISYQEYTPEEGSRKHEFSVDAQVSSFAEVAPDLESMQSRIKQLELDCENYNSCNHALLHEIQQCSSDYTAVLDRNKELERRMKEQKRKQETDLREIIAIIHPDFNGEPSNLVLKEKTQELVERLKLLQLKNKKLEIQKKIVSKDGEKRNDRPRSSKKNAHGDTANLNLLKGFQEGLNSCNASLVRLQKFQELHKKYSNV